MKKHLVLSGGDSASPTREFLTDNELRSRLGGDFVSRKRAAAREQGDPAEQAAPAQADQAVSDEK